MNAVALNQHEKSELKELLKTPIERMTPKQKEELLKLGAKDFSKRFTDTIKKLANE